MQKPISFHVQIVTLGFRLPHCQYILSFNCGAKEISCWIFRNSSSVNRSPSEPEDDDAEELLALLQSKGN